MIPFKNAGTAISGEHHDTGAEGSALLLVLLVLSIFSLLGLFMALEATTGLWISDNYESRARAEYAALAGLSHARALLRGAPDWNAFLRGPDGVYDSSPAYIASAKKYDFRNPLPLVSAHSLGMADPAADIPGLPDDGLMNTGSGGGGIPLIPLTGIAQETPNLSGPGSIVASRYFVKVTDNNGETSEVAGDSTDSPFVDGDGVIIVRSMGVAATVSDVTGSVRRRNSVAVYEGRYKNFTVFDLGPACVVFGSRVLFSFDGTFRIDGDSFPGIGAVDTDVVDADNPGAIIGAGPFGGGMVSGGGLPVPSIKDITPEIDLDPERSRVLNPTFVRDFVFNKSPQFSDNYFNTDQSWDGGAGPDIGFYDPVQPANAPEQNPRITVVHGDLHMSGTARGGGLLVVTGEFECTGDCRYDGLVLVIGAGRALVDTVAESINGGFLIANIDDSTGTPEFGEPYVSIKGNSRITACRSAVKTALSLIPARQISFREIAGVDP